jgi:hypothetical protein
VELVRCRAAVLKLGLIWRSEEMLVEDEVASAGEMGPGSRSSAHLVIGIETQYLSKRHKYYWSHSQYTCSRNLAPSRVRL